MNDKLLAIDTIQDRIFTIRGAQVMLDKDIAAFYEVKAIRLREQVKRNKARFPDDFLFQLTEDEVDYLLSQNAIPSRKQLGGTLPWAFTEQGVAAVSAVIKSQKAEEVSVMLMRAFVEMRRFLLYNAPIFQRLEKVEYKLVEADHKFEKVFKALEEKSTTPRQGIFFDGQMFDAYAFVSGIIRDAKESVILIDNYIDEAVLTLLSKRSENVSAAIYTKNISRQLKLDLKKHNSQYPEIKVYEFKSAHDRFLVLDKTKLYHFGASLKDLGKKWFAFSRMDSMTDDVLQKLKKGSGVE